MALSKVGIPILFTGGVDTHTDSKSVTTTKLINLENGVFSKGSVLSKRNGYSALTRNVDGGDAYQAPKAVAGYRNELLLFADDSLFSYRDSTETWNRVGIAQSVVHSERSISNTGTDQSMPDMATLGGLTAVAWEDSRGGVWYSLIEQSTGRQLVAPSQLNSSGQRPRVCVNGDRLHVYFCVPSANRIYVLVINPASYLDTGAASILHEQLNATLPSYDAQQLPSDVSAIIGSSGGVVMAWSRLGGGISIAYVSPDGTMGYAGNGFPPQADFPTDAITGGIAVSSSNAAIAFVAAAYNSGASATVRTAPVTNLSGGGSPMLGALPAGTVSGQRIALVIGTPRQGLFGSNTTDIWLFVEEPASSLTLNGRDNRVWSGFVNDTLAQGVAGTSPIRGHGLASKAWFDNGTPYVIIAHEVPFFPYAAAVRFDANIVTASISSTAVGRLVVGDSDGLPERAHLPSVLPDASDGRLWRWPGLSRELVVASDRSEQFTPTSIRVVTMDFDNADAFQNAQYQQCLIVAGAMPLRYDGDSISEMGFHCAPDGPITYSFAAGGGLAGSSSYLYAFAYEETDANGIIHQGPMSVGTLIPVPAGNGTVKIQVPTYRLTGKRRVSIAVYRTEANDTAGDNPPMYRVSSLDPSASSQFANGHLSNSTSVDVITFTDTLSDIDLLTRERAYTNAGVLSNDPVGLGSTLSGGKDRLFFSDPTDPNVVIYSKEARDGYGPEMSADLTLRVDPAGGDIGALGILDDSLIVFKRRAIFFVSGSGPLPNPDAAPQIGFSPPVQIPSEVGCVSPRSVVTLSDRAMFSSSSGNGIYQVGRDRQVSFIGEPVDAYKTQVVTSADVVPGTENVIFLTSSGRTLLYDYLHGQWSTYTNHEGYDATVVNGIYYYLRSNPADLRVFRLSDGFTDAGLPIRLYFETAWIKLHGYHQGMQRIWHALFLGQWLSPHTIEFRIGTDYRPGWGDPYIIPMDDTNIQAMYGQDGYGDGPYGGSSDSVYQHRIHVDMKCQAIRFGIGDSLDPVPPSGASFTMSELLLTGGAMRPDVTFGAYRTDGGGGGGGFSPGGGGGPLV